MDHEHFRIPSIFPVLGVGVSIALLTQIEGEVWARAGILIALGLGPLVAERLVVRRVQPASA